jgi:hypothetical protein
MAVPMGIGVLVGMDVLVGIGFSAGGVLVGTGVLAGGVAVQPVCAGFVFPIPLF